MRTVEDCEDCEDCGGLTPLTLGPGEQGGGEPPGVMLMAGGEDCEGLTPLTLRSRAGRLGGGGLPAPSAPAQGGARHAPVWTPG